MPEKDEKVFLKHFHKQLAVPFVMYADFESILYKERKCMPNNNTSYTESYQKHTCCSYGYKVVCCYDDRYSKKV